MRVRIGGLILALLICATLGCGGGGDASVTGKVVTDDGETVEDGLIIFTPTVGGIKGANAIVNKDGTFELKTSGDQGIWSGEYSLEYWTLDPPVDGNGKAISPPSKWKGYKIPKDFTVTVGPGKNDIPVELVK
jgi:hypothetical protein